MYSYPSISPADSQAATEEGGSTRCRKADSTRVVVLAVLLLGSLGVGECEDQPHMCPY
jgi:hypothetical protein